jgi:hypothetical protein
MKTKYYYFISYKTKGLYKSILAEPINVPKPYKEISEFDYRKFYLQLTRSPEYEIGFDDFGNPKVFHFSEKIDVSQLKEKIANYHIDTINEINRTFLIEYNNTFLLINSPIFQLLESTYVLGRANFLENLIVKDDNGNVCSLDFDSVEQILIKKNMLLRKINSSKVDISTLLLNCNDKNKLMDTYKKVKYKDFIK